MFLKTILVAFLFVVNDSNDCKLLTDGSYSIRYIHDSVQFDSGIKIRKDHFTQKFPNGDSASGKLVWIRNCGFILDYANPPKQDTSDLQRLLLKLFGEPFFELQEKREDTIYFRTTFTGNPHLTGSSGYLLKLD